MARSLKTRSSFVAALVLLGFTACALAQTSTVAPRNRIVSPIVDSDVVTLMGNVHRLATPEFDRGVLSDETRLERMVLLLQPDADQQKALDELTQAQQEPGSPSFHQWLSPEEYGSRFGASAADLAKVTAWLQSRGFAIEPVPAGHRAILFSGTVAQVTDTFHTEMHRYEVGGQMHIANSQDPQIPSALATVVGGVLSLHDFRRNSQIRSIRPALSPRSATLKPEYSSGSTHYIFPADYATIYDLNPQYTAGLTGTGVSLAIVGRSNINLSDVSSFRSGSSLSANQPTVILEGANPGLVSGDQDESTLDVEWSGAIAPGAAVKFVVGASTSTTDGVDLSAQYIVNNKTATVMSTSYGSCEADMGSGEMAFYNSLWQQAASEGISAFVSSGDSGAAGCNGGSSSSGSGNGVNGLCSSPYSTCVGGTEFNEGSGNYWATTNGADSGSALSYIPEKVWNESASDGGSGLWASTGGISEYYTQPTWQKGVSGANSNGMRAVPDVAMTAASHDGYMINENGSWYVIAGTSAASPSFAGVMAIVDQKLGGGLGNANPTLYSMLGASQNPFHATPSGNNSVPGVTGFTASGAAYNLATGLGSVDANLLVNGWPANGTVIPAPGFTLKGSATSESVLQGKTATFTVAVTATGGFSGTVSLKATTPAGVTLSFNPVSVKPGASSTATITVASTATPGTSNITITGASGTTTATTSIPLTVLGTPTLTIAESATKVSVAQGATGTLQFTTATGGAFSGAVSLAVSGLPTGVSATWTTGSYTSSADGSTISTLTLKPSTTAALATTSLKITATGDGLTASTTASIQVTAAPAITATLAPASISMLSMATSSMTVTVAPVGGVSLASSASTATFKVTGLPAGITGAWSAASLTSAGALQAKLTLTGGTSAVASSTKPAIAVTAVDSVTGKTFSATASATLTVSRVLPTLVVTLAASKVTLVAGQSGTLQVTTTTGGSYAGVVALSLTGLPAGVTATWTNGSYTSTVAGSTTSTLTLKSTTAAAVATTALKIAATGDGVTGQASESLQVTPAPAITATLAPASISMLSMATSSMTVTVAPVGGVSLASSVSTATFKVTGLPAGITGTWGAAALTSAGTLQAKLTLTGGTSALASSTKPAIAVTAVDSVTGKTFSATASATLTVTHVLPTLVVTPAASKITLVAGQSGTLQVATTTGGSYAGVVALSVTGLPAGVTATWTNGSYTSTVAGSTTSTLTLKSTTAAAVATTALKITATGDGVTGQASESLQVTPAPAITVALSPATINMKSTASQAITLTVNPIGGVKPDASSTGSSFQVTGLPAGFTAAWGTPALTVAGAMQVTLTLTGSSTAITSTCKPTVTAQVHDSTTGILYTATAQAALAVTRPNALAISATEAALSIGKGKTATNTITISTSGTFTTAVSLSISGLPAGVSATWSANPLTPSGSAGQASATLTLKSATTAPLASATVVITASGDGISVTKSMTMQVTN
jgi:pseudomonalisin